MTVPVNHSSYQKPILDARISQDGIWAKKHWKTIEQNYGNAEFFDKYKPFFSKLYADPPVTLAELNERIILFLMKEFGITTEIVRASELGVDTSLKKTDLILDILKKSLAETYVSGPSGKNYLDASRFTDIKLDYHTFKHPIYRQLNGEFIPNLSALDILLNEGPEAGKIVRGK